LPQGKPSSDAQVIARMGGKTFKTNFSMAKQAMQFPKLANDLIDLGCTITTDCDGLIEAVVDDMRAAPAL
jgi:hypothetical protein